MDLRQLLVGVLDLADKVNDYLPGAPASQLAINLGRKLDDLIDTFGDKIPPEEQVRARETRKRLAERITAKSRLLSSNLRGK